MIHVVVDWKTLFEALHVFLLVTWWRSSTTTRWVDIWLYACMFIYKLPLHGCVNNNCAVLLLLTGVWALCIGDKAWQGSVHHWVWYGRKSPSHLIWCPLPVHTNGNNSCLTKSSARVNAGRFCSTCWLPGACQGTTNNFCWWRARTYWTRWRSITPVFNCNVQVYWPSVTYCIVVARTGYGRRWYTFHHIQGWFRLSCC